MLWYGIYYNTVKLKTVFCYDHCDINITNKINTCFSAITSYMLIISLDRYLIIIFTGSMFVDNVNDDDVDDVTS